jgi:hypothetical protein
MDGITSVKDQHILAFVPNFVIRLMLCPEILESVKIQWATTLDDRERFIEAYGSDHGENASGLSRRSIES